MDALNSPSAATSLGRDLVAHVRASGFAHPESLIHFFIGGSELHGAKVHGTDDLDIYGVYIEPPEQALGLDPMPHYTWSTAGDDRRNGPEDVDVTLYSLRKWAGLAAKGNPTALHFLFAGSALQHPIWQMVKDHRHLFLARTCVPNFTGFADAQLKRMTGERGRGKKGQRPELENQFGFDVKAGMHALRLLYECKELVECGNISLPRPEREFLISVRTGKLSLEKVLATAQQLFHECEQAEKTSPLPAEVDRAAVSRLIADCYRTAWETTERSSQ